MKEIIELLSKQRFSVENEKELQAQISTALATGGFVNVREYRLNAKSIIDIYVPDPIKGGVGIEIKISGTAKSIHAQLSRYAFDAKITSLILITNRTIGLAPTLNDKPIQIIKLGKAWL